MQFALSYLSYFFYYLLAAWPLLAMLTTIVVLLGLIVGKVEAWRRFDAVYWSFITATTVGYGDFRPKKHLSRILAVLIAFVGVTFTGIVVALAVHAATMAFREVHGSPVAGLLTRPVAQVPAELQKRRSMPRLISDKLVS